MALEENIQSFILERIKAKGARLKIPLSILDENSDLFSLIDSFEFLDLISAIEKHFSLSVDFSDIGPDALSTIKGLSHQCAISSKAGSIPDQGDSDG